jgi:5-methylcytosine-specific restriction endonuclease McrBC regulatory subunit McrC
LETIKDEVKMIVEATPKFRTHDLRKVLLANKKAVIRHAYFSEYRELQRLCVMILQSEKQEIGFGSNRVYGVLFDGAWLWEEYINLVVNGDKERFYHPQNKAHKGNQWLFLGDKGYPVGEIYPDFIGKNSAIIADAKYKPVRNIGNADYFQVLAYMYRFDAKQGYYFYPEKDENVEHKKLILYQGMGSAKTIRTDDITLTKLGFKVPQNVSKYEHFEEEMKKAECNFISDLSN